MVKGSREGSRREVDRARGRKEADAAAGVGSRSSLREEEDVVDGEGEKAARNRKGGLSGR